MGATNEVVISHFNFNTTTKHTNMLLLKIGMMNFFSFMQNTKEKDYTHTSILIRLLCDWTFLIQEDSFFRSWYVQPCNILKLYIIYKINFQMQNGLTLIKLKNHNGDIITQYWTIKTIPDNVSLVMSRPIITKQVNRINWNWNKNLYELNPTF